jgi:phenylalanyl-tRNA synthetase alpha chain
MLNSEYTELISSLDKELGECINDTKIIEARNIFINKNVTPLYQKIKTIPNDQKAEFGKQLNELKATIEEHVNKYLQEHLLQKEKTDHVVNYDILAQTSDFTKGSVSPITLVFRQILGYFESLNFTIQSGEEVMQSKYNFDHLNVPETHPTRETSETFYVKSDKSASLRTQNTASSAAFIDNFKGDELRVCNFGYTYRNDDDDPTHTHQFNQIDFI